MIVLIILKDDSRKFDGKITPLILETQSMVFLLLLKYLREKKIYFSSLTINVYYMCYTEIT
jgi:hypothetical protein